ncbi:hypothetical protein NW768_006739 [Fusarium equiseti]|uniref:Uncharacterized protein n=1 Tax=Fusarium equiseti TaxID=61235 RepID=A0ABQ8R916_FUSEQ|nr:hypothetical protein NW768_006739 [Fusarium equiseti]
MSDSSSPQVERPISSKIKPQWIRLLHALNYDPEVITGDTNFMLLSSEHTNSKAAAMLSNNMFQVFMAETQASTRLLVNGHGDLSTVGGVSPFSHVVAEASRVSNTTNIAGAPTFIIKYFCREHKTKPSWNKLSSPTGMLTNVIGQLVLQMHEKDIALDLSFISHSKWQKLEDRDVRTLCSVFKRIVEQVPRGGVVLCAIDEISVYTRALLEHETGIVVSKLVQMVRRNGNGPVFKLLVTCYERASLIEGLFSGYTLDMD